MNYNVPCLPDGSPFRMLYKLFRDRFFEDESVSPGTGFETNTWQVMGTLITIGFFVTWFGLPAFVEMTFKRNPAISDLIVLRALRLFLPALTFAVTGFATAFQWDSLFPDRRDFVILSQFPVSLLTILTAKFAALGAFLMILIGSINALPIVGCVLVMLAHPGAWGILVGQIASAAGAGISAFLLVVCLQGLLINLTSARHFLRISPWAQMIGMCVMVLAILMFPLYFYPVVITQEWWIRLFPPAWCTGFYDLVLPNGSAFFAGLGRYGMCAIAAGIGFFLASWSLGFSRHYRQTLETEGVSRSFRSRDRLRAIARSPEEWAMFSFCRKTLARSNKHRLFLATWGSAGLAIGLLVAVAGKGGNHIVWSPSGARSLPFSIAFFLISGFRTVFQFPADLHCNWLMQLTESRWSETARLVTRKIVLVCCLIPVLAVIWPFEIYAAGPARGSFHVLFQLAIGMVLIEITFAIFRKLPFTCSYFAGKASLALLLAIYAYGFSAYAFNMADTEQWLETRPLLAVAGFVAAGAAMPLLWKPRRDPEEVIFDGSEPVIQTLDLF